MSAGRVAMTDEPLTAISRQLESVYREIDVARAIYRGAMLIGHRRSLDAGEMIWAIPGGGMVYQSSLIRDLEFSVATAPNPVRLVYLQGRLKRIRAQAARQGSAA